ncbi:MAG: RNA-guided endonuclease TnpB family protein [Trebonia sp.]
MAPWWRECSKEAFSTGLDQLARALKNWGDSRKGKRKGRPAGFPRFRSKRKARPSVRFTTGAVRCEVTHAVLPRLGRIKLHERADTGIARILSAAVRRERGRWFVSFTVEQDISRPAPSRPDVTVGVDLGIKTLAVLAGSSGQASGVPNPRYLSRGLRKIRCLSRTVSRRQGPDRRTRRQPSNRWRRADAARNRAVAKVTDQRRDGIHKLTTVLASTYGTIVVEDLHVAGMMRNRRLARHVADASFAEIRSLSNCLRHQAALFICVASWVWMVGRGLLIHTLAGSRGATGRRLRNRSGRAANAASRISWRRSRIFQADPSCTVSGVWSPIPEWRCSVL